METLKLSLSIRSNDSFEENEKNLIRSFNFNFRYVNHVISLNKVDDFVNCIYAIELVIKHSTDTAKSTSCHDLHLVNQVMVVTE
jgi:hypothetical protein